MEQAIWLFVGVISVIIGIGIVMQIMNTGAEGQGLDDIVFAVDKLQTNLNFICKSPYETRLTTEVTLPSGAVLTGDTDKLCITLEDEIRCRFIDCDFVDETDTVAIYTLDLNTEIALKAFKARPFGCVGERLLNGVNLVCQG